MCIYIYKYLYFCIYIYLYLFLYTYRSGNLGKIETAKYHCTWAPRNHQFQPLRIYGPSIYHLTGHVTGHLGISGVFQVDSWCHFRVVRVCKMHTFRDIPEFQSTACINQPSTHTFFFTRYKSIRTKIAEEHFPKANLHNDLTLLRLALPHIRPMMEAFQLQVPELVGWILVP